MSHNITVEGGTSVRLKTAGKYCDRDIIVTATSGGGAEPIPTQEKTIDITENGAVEVVPDDGFALSKVTANVNVPIPDGYIKPSGTKEITENGTHDVEEYETVTVNVQTGGGGEDWVKQLAEGTVTELSSNTVTIVKRSAFESNQKIKSVSFPNCTTIETYAFGNSALQSMDLPKVTTIGSNSFAGCKFTSVSFPHVKTLSSGTSACFQSCTKLTSASFPNLTAIPQTMFNGCSKLTELYAPLVTEIMSSAFQSCAFTQISFPLVTKVDGAFSSCRSLTVADFPLLASIGAWSFNYCSALTTLILRKSDGICTLANVNGFNNSAIATGTGYVYVPVALIDQYKSATNWTKYAAQFRAIEDYPDICGGAG
jgi:hypothetical protein